MSQSNEQNPGVASVSDATTSISELKDCIQQFVSERDWDKFHLPKNIAMSIAIEAGELMEHFQWTNPDPPAYPLPNDSPVAQELADVFAYTLRLAHVLGIDLSQAFESKMRANRIKYPVGATYNPKSI
jgi:NTP pyrophosphatase (non-canonical NTP hydrolase)